jgi:opacity protein-like surface antigen
MKKLLIISMLAVGLLPAASFAAPQTNWLTCLSYQELNSLIAKNNGNLVPAQQYSKNATWSSLDDTNAKLSALTLTKLLVTGMGGNNNYAGLECHYSSTNGGNVTFTLNTTANSPVFSPEKQNEWQPAKDGSGIVCDSAHSCRFSYTTYTS